MKNKTAILIIITSLVWSVLLNFMFIYEKKKRDIIVDNATNIIDHFEKKINRIVNYYEDELSKYDNTTIDTIPYTAIIGDWKFTKDSMEYIGRKDTICIVNIDSIRSLYKYIRVVLNPPIYDKINLMTVCYGDFDNWKKREVDGITQYSLDGTNWFEL